MGANCFFYPYCKRKVPAIHGWIGEFGRVFCYACKFIDIFLVIGINHWQLIAGLIIGGSIAAPFAAYLTSRIPVRGGLIMVGVVVIVVSLRILFKTFF